MSVTESLTTFGRQLSVGGGGVRRGGNGKGRGGGLGGGNNPGQGPGRGPTEDADAAVWLNAIEAADGAPLNPAIRAARNTFVLGLKANGMFDKFTSLVVMNGATTLAGMTVPLVGPTPTLVGAFSLANYNPETGYKPAVSVLPDREYIRTGVFTADDPQTDCHMAVYNEDVGTGPFVGPSPIGSGGTTGGQRALHFSGVAGRCAVKPDFNNIDWIQETGPGASVPAAFFGYARNNNLDFKGIQRGELATVTRGIQAQTSNEHLVFNRNTSGVLNGLSTEDSFKGRLSYYSTGKYLDLVVLGTLVDQLIAATKAAL